MLAGRSGLSDLAGITFGGKRDVFRALGYKKDLGPQDYHQRYRRDGVAARVVEAYPKATWRSGGDLVEDEDPDTETPFELEWDALAERLHVWPIFERADVLAGLGTFAVVLIGGPGDFNLPLLRARADEIVYLTPFSQLDAKVKDADYVKRTDDPRFGQPEFYTLKRISPGSSTETRVHWTRIVHVPDGLLDDHVNGLPRLERVWNRLDDLEKVTGGGSEAFWQRANGGVQFDLNPDVVMSSEQERKLSEEIDEFMHGQRRYARTRGITMNSVGAEVAHFHLNATAILQQISAATGIPVRILTGSERGELASTQDKDSWDQRVSDRRKQFAGPIVVRQFVDRLIAIGALPQPEQYEVRWPQAQDLNDSDRAGLALSLAKVNQANGSTVILEDEIRDRALGLPPLSEVTDDVDGEDVDEEEDTRPVARGDEESAREDEDEAEERAAALPASRAIARAAERHENRVRVLMVGAFGEARRRVDMTALATAATLADEDAANARVAQAIDDAFGDLTELLAGRLRDALISGGRAAAVNAGRAGGFLTLRAAATGISFDRTNPAAQAWADEHAAVLIAQVSDETKAAIRAVISQAFAQGLPPREAARRIRALIGLTAKAAGAVELVRRELEAAAPRDVVRAGKVRIRVPRAGASAAFIRQHVGRYAERLLRLRALTIARHETMTASNEGQAQLWRQAVESGLLTGEEVREAIITPDERLCPICAALEGQQVGLNEPFRLASGETRMNPPFHVQCRCSQGIVGVRARRSSVAA